MNKAIIKPHHKYFFELIEEALLALNQLKTIVIPTRGIRAVNSELKFLNINPTHGSLRFNADIKGRIFLHEFRPVSLSLKKGHFYSIKSERPFWEVVGTFLIRLNKKRKRNLENIARHLNESQRKKSQYCLIMQGGVKKELIRSLLERGQVSFNSHNDLLVEGPLYSALSILSKLSTDQIVETKINNEQELKKELVYKLASKGKLLKEVACVVGKNQYGDYYTSSEKKEHHFPVKVWKDNVIPVSIAREIAGTEDVLLRDNRLLVLDNISLLGLVSYLQNPSNFKFSKKQPSIVSHLS